MASFVLLYIRGDRKIKIRLTNSSTTYIKSVDPVLDGHAISVEVAILAHGIHNSGHGGICCSVVVLCDRRTHLHLVFHISVPSFTLKIL